ncbi:uncharacterized protein CDAR_532171 [Caerostris darwini]|uniref:Uncharacterized protein n=1 Tax=Caerostris darwini TaxID=1538125 RepID=A0AAV4PNH8_9ARAC|nr:uncharacterized protein CDAR_532171 [Caerostris darwini]
MHSRLSLVERRACAQDTFTSARTDDHPAGIRHRIRQYRPFLAGGVLGNHRKHLCIDLIEPEADDFSVSFGFGELYTEKKASRRQQTTGFHHPRRYDPQVGKSLVIVWSFYF